MFLVYVYMYSYNLWCMYVYNYVVVFVYVYILCMYIFYITLARKNGLGRLPEYNNQSINQSINTLAIQLLYLAML